MSQNKHAAVLQQIRPLIANDEFKKVADAIQPYVRVRLYEDSFADKILAVRQVTTGEYFPEIKEDTWWTYGKVEQGTAQAVGANIQDRGFERYLSGPRYKIVIGKHKTPIATKAKDEMEIYDYDLLADAAEKDINELGQLRDFKLIQMMNECVRISGKVHVDVRDSNSAGPVQIDKVHVNRLETVLNSGGRTGRPLRDQLKTTRILLNDDTRRDFALLPYTSTGDVLAGEFFTKGFTVDQVQGVQYISSIKKNLLTEHDHTTIVKFGSSITASSSIVVNGVTFTVASAGTGVLAAKAFADAINASVDPAVKAVVEEAPMTFISAVAEGQYLRITAHAFADDDTRDYLGAPVALTLTGAAGATTGTAVAAGKGDDSYDIVWAFPDKQFMGEIIRVSGRDIQTEMWRTDGEDLVRRKCTEWFGMAMGNFNGVAKLRMQRNRVLPTA